MKKTTSLTVLANAIRSIDEVIEEIHVRTKAETADCLIAIKDRLSAEILELDPSVSVSGED